MEKLKRMMVVVLSCFMFVTSMTASVSAEETMDPETVQPAEELVDESAVSAEEEPAETTVEEEPAVVEAVETVIAEEPAVAEEPAADEPISTTEAVGQDDAEIISETFEMIKSRKPGAVAMPLAEPGEGDQQHIGATKTVTDPDGDGIYEMALTVTGQATSTSTTQVDKSNVIIVMDRSGSMSNNTYVKFEGTPETGVNYYRQVTNAQQTVTYQRVYYRNGAWRLTNSNTGQIYTGDVYVQETRINAEQAALDEVVQNLLANNTPGDAVLSDVIEISIIGYSLKSPFCDNDGNVVPGTQISNSTSYEAIMAAVNNDSQSQGTNWDDGLREALREANALKDAEPDDSVHIVFLTDGEPTASHGDSGYTTGEDNYWRHWGNANTQATAIVNAGFNFYSIFTYGSNNTYINYLNNLTRSAHGVGTYTQQNFGSNNTYHENFFNATDTTALVEAFNAIVNKIQSNVGYAGVEFEDGVTLGVTNTSVTVDGTVHTDSFHYTVLKGNTVVYTVKFTTSGSTTTATFTINGNTYTTSELKEHKADLDGNGTEETYTYYSVEVDGTEYKMAPATMNAEGMVDWKLAGLGILENGWTYKLTFDVWPNQLAYDMVADLNNGVKSLAEIKSVVTTDQGAAMWEQIEKALLVTYTDPNTGTSVTAALNTLSDEIKAGLESGEIKASYSILTNYSQKVSYYTADEEIDEETGEVIGTSYTSHDPYYPPQPDAVALTSTTMDLEKIWDDSLDEDQLKELLWNDYNSEDPSDPTKYQVPLIIWKSDTEMTVEEVAEKTEQIATANNLTSQSTEAEIKAAFASDENFYMTKILGWHEDLTGYLWMDEMEVAPGTLVTLETAEDMELTIVDDNIVSYNGTDYYMVESGHYYTVSEINIDRHFELNTIVYHPMLVNRQVQNVTFTDEFDENGHRIIDSIVPMSAVNAYNTLKGGINVRKQILDFDDNEVTASDDQFTVKITMKDPDGAAYTDFDYRIYYGENNPKYQDTENYPKHRTGHVFGTSKNEDTSTEVTTDTEPGENYHAVLNNTDGIVEITLYVGDTLRVINVPAGVTYSVEETEVNGGTIAASDYAYVQIDYEIAKGSSAEENFETDTANDQGTYTVVGNAANRATVVNRVPVASVELFKEDAATKAALEGIEFKLYAAYTTADAEDNYQVVKDAYGNDIGTDGLITTGADGRIAIGSLTAGTYYLVETKTNAGYTLLEKPIKFVIEKVDAEGTMEATVTDMDDEPYQGVTVAYDAATSTFTLTVDNNPEYFYVYHSADNTIERIALSDDRVTSEYDAEANTYAYTFNIAEESKKGYLYGGYYKKFAGAGMTDDEVVAATYTDTEAGVDYEYKASGTGGYWAEDTAGTAYTGELAAQWSSAEFYSESGLEMTPENGKVYYLKEVPDTKYLQPYTHYTYYKTAPYKIANLWMLSDIDDLNYMKTGFIITTDDEAKVCVSLTVTNQVGGAKVTLTPQKVFRAKGVTSNNYLTYCQEDGSVKTAAAGKGLSDLRSGSADVTMYWISPDNVFVTSAVKRTVTGDGTKTGIGKVDNIIASTLKAAE